MRLLTSYDLIARPLFTEKSKFSQEMRKYTFVVHKTANKFQIKNAIEQIFKVTVRSVNITRSPYKNKIFKGKKGVKKGYKKAIVSLKDNQRIELGA